MPALQHLADRDRRQGARQAVGGEHREDHGEAERREQIFRRPFEKGHRGEDAADRESRYQCRDGDLGGAMQCRARQRHFFFVEQTIGVLDRHRRIVDENADRERKAPQCHRVDRLAEKIEHDE